MDSSVDGRRPNGDGQRRRVPMATHRLDVVRRLLERGMSATTLARLLPEFAPLIERAAGRARGRLADRVTQA